MEEALGKRIAFHRKRLGLTQDALAEQPGVIRVHCSVSFGEITLRYV